MTITLTTTRTDWNGPDAPQTGYNYATAADISLTLNQPAPAPAPLTPPAADIPGYQHVFLFYFENEDYSQVIGHTRQALIEMKTGHVYPPVTVGSYPVAATITG
ncbi:MAG: hypothetical protein ACRDN1_15100 [Trebonia sp.]